MFHHFMCYTFAVVVTYISVISTGLMQGIVGAS